MLTRSVRSEGRTAEAYTEPDRATNPGPCHGAPVSFRNAAGCWAGALPALVATVILLLTAPVARADWNTSERGAWGAHRCQARNVLQGGLLLLGVGVGLAADAQPRSARGVIGLSLAGTGVGATLAGAILRIRQPSNPGATNDYESWPGERCSARAMIIRGSITLTFGLVLLTRMLLQESPGRYGGRAKLFAFLVGVLPPLAIGAIQLGLGIRRLRKLGPRPAPPVVEALGVNPYAGPFGVSIGRHGALIHMGGSF